jgi:uncharacterized Tic20 family protein
MTPSSEQTRTPRSASVPAAALSPERWRLGPNGQVRDMLARDADRAVACIMHLWILSGAILGPVAVLLPLGLWIALRRRSPLIDDHGREVMNAQITMLVLVVVVCVGWVLLVPWLLIWLVSLVRGSVAGAGGEIFRYPVLIRLIP